MSVVSLCVGMRSLPKWTFCVLSTVDRPTQFLILKSSDLTLEHSKYFWLSPSSLGNRQTHKQTCMPALPCSFPKLAHDSCTFCHKSYQIFILVTLACNEFRALLFVPCYLYVKRKKGFLNTVLLKANKMCSIVVETH